MKKLKASPRWQEMMKEWVEIFEKNNSKLPTDYAKFEPEEGFADCYAVWRMKGKIDKIFSDFLEKWIGRREK